MASGSETRRSLLGFLEVPASHRMSILGFCRWLLADRPKSITLCLSYSEPRLQCAGRWYRSLKDPFHRHSNPTPTTTPRRPSPFAEQRSFLAERLLQSITQPGIETVRRIETREHDAGDTAAGSGTRQSWLACRRPVDDCDRHVGAQFPTSHGHFGRVSLCSSVRTSLLRSEGLRTSRKANRKQSEGTDRPFAASSTARDLALLCRWRTRCLQWKQH